MKRLGFVVALALVLGLMPGSAAVSADHLSVTFLSVGQSDAILYEGSCGERGLVDAGAGDDDYVLAELDRRGSRALEWMSVSHYDADHVGDIADIGRASGVSVEAVYDRGGDRNAKDTDTYRDYYDWVTGEGIRQPVDIGDVFDLCSGDQRVTFTVTSVGTDGTAADGKSVSEENDRGVCVHVEYKDFDLASCGDVNGTDDGSRSDVETAVADSYGDVEVAKVNHHGSRYSSNATYVSTLQAQVAVISVGKNSYGHPSSDVFLAWARHGETFQTQEPREGQHVDGDVTVTTSGTGSFSVATSASGVANIYPTDETGHAYDDCVVREFGNSRMTTALALSRRTHTPTGGAVVLARADDFADALAGAPHSYDQDAPILLTGPGSLDPTAAGEIVRLNPSSVFLLGGTAALSEQVERDVEVLGYSTSRIAGANRFDTAAKIARTLGSPDSHVYIAEGNRGWPDAVSGSGLAGMQHRPILTVATDALPGTTRQTLQDMGITSATIIGGSAVISEQVAEQVADPDSDGTQEIAVDRIAGANRYDTSRQVADVAVDAGADARRLWLATGGNWPDALAAGPAVAADSGLLVLIEGSNGNAGNVDQFTSRDDFAHVSLAGGPAAISNAVAARVDANASCSTTSDGDSGADGGDTQSDISISNVVADPEGDDVQYNEGEYVELTNNASSTIDVGGWYLTDEASHQITIPDGYQIEPGTTLRVYTGPGDDTDDRYYDGRGQAVWNNDGDTATLYDDAGTQIDQFSY